MSLFAGLLPIPGGIGVTEAGLTLGLTAAGVPSETAFAIALAYRIVQLLPAAHLGLVLLPLARRAPLPVSRAPSDSGALHDPCEIGPMGDRDVKSDVSDVKGDVAAGWEGVADVLQASIDRGDDTGASVAVYHRGTCVVDVAGGAFTRGGPPYDRSTLQLVFSTTKGITAIAVAMCVERGLLDYDERVATYWPEFAAAGKGDATVAQLLSHQLGLFTVDGLTFEQALDWDTVAAALAAKEPEWPIGSAHGYHAVTYGWLAGELVRRVDGRSLAAFVADEIVEPLGVELWIGLPESEEHRVSPLIRDPPEDVPPDVQAMFDAVMGPDTNGGRALSLSGAFPARARVQLAAGARRRAAGRQRDHERGVAGEDLRRHARARRRCPAARRAGALPGARRVTPDGELDACLLAETTFGMGFMVHGPFTAYSGPGSYGHPGAGGSVAFADPERELAMAYAMNTMATNLAGDMRAQQLHRRRRRRRRLIGACPGASAHRDRHEPGSGHDPENGLDHCPCQRPCHRRRTCPAATPVSSASTGCRSPRSGWQCCAR